MTVILGYIEIDKFKVLNYSYMNEFKKKNIRMKRKTSISKLSKKWRKQSLIIRNM